MNPKIKIIRQLLSQVIDDIDNGNYNRTDDEINAAIDQVIDKLVSQLRRYNDKAKSKMGKQGIRTVGVNDEQDEKFERVKFLDLVPMTSEEALDQMELLGHDFFIYQDKETKKTNVIYLREDGNYAIIETTTK